MFRIVRADRLKMLEAVHATYCGLIIGASHHESVSEAVGAFLTLAAEFRRQAQGRARPQFQVLSTVPPIEGHVVALVLIGPEDGSIGLSKAGAEEALKRFKSTEVGLEYLLGLLADNARAMADETEARHEEQWVKIAGWLRDAQVGD